jgi:SSS family solute:Na+ symporter
MGGIEAVIWTDFAQAIVMLAGALVSVLYVLAKTGVAPLFQVAAEHHKFRMITQPGDLSSVLTIFLILETIVQTIRIYGTQQDMTQRYMTTGSTEKANRSVWISILGFIPVGFVFFFIGSALFVYYLLHPNTAVPALIASGRADAIYPYFVADELPIGLAGLVIAAIFAASMSSIDACMNANSTVCVEDFHRRFARRERSDHFYLNEAKLLTLLWGALATGMAILMMEIEYAQIVWNKILAISTNGVLGLMALAFLPRPVRAWAAVAGFLASYACLFTMMWFLQVKPAVILTYPVAAGSTICFLLWSVVGNLACFLTALILDRIVERAA